MARLGVRAPFAVAVSGGGDSVALMLLVSDWLHEAGRGASCSVLIVDHGLREASSREAKLVAGWAERAGLGSHVLAWRGRKPRANIEERARNARYTLMGDWCVANKTSQLLLAHTRDDQAETFLLRLGRGSGVDGLSAMSVRSRFPLPGYDEVELIRPLLDIGRSELRDFLRARGADWLEDPMNTDSRFTRARVRGLLPHLESAGIGVSRIAKAAAHLARARQALDRASGVFFGEYVKEYPDGLLLDAQALRQVPREIGLRVLSACLLEAGGTRYRPRFERLEPLYEAVVAPDFNRARTLAGCRIGLAPKARQDFGPKTLEIRRESPRKAAMAAKIRSESQFVTGTGSASRQNLPKKGRIMLVPYNS